MRNRKQRVVLKGQASSLADVKACVPQGSTFAPPLFLTYINDLADDLPNAKLFADDTALISVVHNVNNSADEVNNDLVKVNLHPSGRLYSPARMRNSRWKTSHNFQRLPLFSMLYDDFVKFSKNRDKELILGPMYFIFPPTGNYITSCI